MAIKKGPTPYGFSNQVPQGNNQPLERISGPAYDLKFNPDHTNMMQKLQMPPEESEGMRQQLLQQYPPGSPNASQNYDQAMTQSLKQRLIQLMQQRQGG